VVAGWVQPLSVNSAGVPGGGIYSCISAKGDRAAFDSGNLVPEDNGMSGLYLAKGINPAEGNPVAGRPPQPVRGEAEQRHGGRSGQHRLRRFL
jgi:hypothetical protein